jgi:apolipoprotein N-acyltransferase
LTRLKRYLFSITAGLLLGVAWPFTGSLFPLLFVGLVPLLLLENYFYKNKERFSAGKVWSQAYLAFFVFNCVSGWWIYYASGTGLLMAVLLNSFFMATVFWLYHITKRHLGPKEAAAGLLLYWVGFEYMHLWWDFSYPWLNFGNGFANVPWMVQWYELTGTHGGTLWILIINLLVAKLWIRSKDEKKSILKQKRSLITIGLFLFVPIIASVIRYNTYEDGGETIEVVAVQPNIDPYHGKFNSDPMDQLSTMLAIGDSLVTENTDYLVFPETALQEKASARASQDGLEKHGLWEGIMGESQSVGVMRQYMAQYPKLHMVSGMASSKMYRTGHQGSETSRELGESGIHYDHYNSALYLDQSDSIQIYYKSQPLIGVERMPFTWLMKHFEDFIFQMGGTTGSLGVQEEREVFAGNGAPAIVAPVICYESVFGEFVGEFVLEHNANVIFIITNDGWWDNTPGHRQHNAYASLRAIEHRRSIARSANTGISCFVNQRGDISQATEWWVPTAIKGNITLNNEKTFYTEYGDYLGRFCFYVSFLLLLYVFVVRFKRKNDPLAPKSET